MKGFRSAIALFGLAAVVGLSFFALSRGSPDGSVGPGRYRDGRGRWGREGPSNSAATPYCDGTSAFCLDYTTLAECDTVAPTARTSDAGTLTQTSARSTVGWCQKSDGTVVSMAINAPRIFSSSAQVTAAGILTEPAATNSVTAPRDLTDVSWVASNVTAARVTGADGVAASGSTITATANNGTILTTVTTASAKRASSMVLKRRTGTGAFSVTRNNGTTYVDVGPSLSTTTWKRVELNCGGAPYGFLANCIEWSAGTATAANPVIGFKFGTSGDAVDVDFVQDELGPYASSPFVATRDYDLHTFPASNLPVTGGELSIDLSTRLGSGGTSSSLSIIDTRNDGSHCGIDLLGEADNGKIFFGTEKNNSASTTRSPANVLPVQPGQIQNYRWVWGTLGGNTCVQAWQHGVLISSLCDNTAVVPDCHGTSVRIGAFPPHDNQGAFSIQRVRFRYGPPQIFDGGTAIFLVGDSTAAGIMGTLESRNPAVLQAALGGTASEKYVTSTATSGWTVDQCRTSWDGIVTSTAGSPGNYADKMIWLCGTNSAVADGGIGEWNKIGFALDTAVDAGIRVLPSTITPCSGCDSKLEYISVVNAQILNWCSIHGVTCADLHAALVGGDGGLSPTYDYGDGLHMNDAGIIKIVQTWTATGTL